MERKQTIPSLERWFHTCFYALCVQIKAFLADPSAFVVAAPVAEVKEEKEAPAAVEEEEEESDDDMGLDLFG